MEKITCPRCGASMSTYDHVKRQIVKEFGEVEIISVARLRCGNCNRIKRMLPDNVIPYKRYRKDIIEGFIDGRNTIFELEFEDYPCEVTIKRWVDGSKK